METVVGLKELRENLQTYERKVRRGHTFIVMKRSKPIFMISPVNEGGWETVIDFTKFRKSGISAKELLARLKKL
jgi:antitoxin (DNA-binding transcriptional repressor) of toxin-antitoxin stability system